MTKLESIEHKIFASEAPLDEIGQFGSALDTTKLNTKDVTTIQALPAYTKGWGSAVISDSNYPTMEEMNGVLNVMSYHTGYLYQEGMPAWRSDREYSATSIVKEPTGTKFFRSLKDGNIGNALDNTEYWEELKFGGSGLELCDTDIVIRDDVKMFNQLQQMRRSTFDLSKFGIVGSPTITDDGIASGFSGSNFIRVPIAMQNAWKIQMKSTFTNISDILSPLFVISNFNRIVLGNNGTITIFASEDNATSKALNFNKIALSINKDYLLTFEFDGVSTYTFTAKDLNTNTENKQSLIFNSKFYNSASNWDIGSDASRYVRGSIDLKQFSITVDGKEVFNGNKTGLDVIKPDNYEVVGSPVISEDGVASGFNNVNYLRGATGITLGDNFKIQAKFTTGDDVTSYQGILRTQSTTGFLCSISNRTNSSRLVLNMSDKGDISVIPVMKASTGYEILIECQNGLLTTYYSENNSNLIKVSEVENINITLSNTLLALGNNSNPYYWHGSINLNAFKIYVDGNLVYQPCLKIPYTLSKTGSKIVDVAYRDRVIDLYEQEGQAGYYTIDEENQNFTLPMGEIYGMIEKKVSEKEIYNKLTNCLLEVPQRIKLELNGGMLTLKAGSQVIVPNGFEADGTTLKFDYVTVGRDVTNTSIPAAGTYMINYTTDNNFIGWSPVNMTYSGTSDSATNNSLYYNTGLNTCTQYTGAGDIHSSSFPLAIVVSDGSTGVTSIDQIFNGFGYIGSTVWADKGIKCLAPNGRNEDGSLNNIEFTTDKVFTFTDGYSCPYIMDRYGITPAYYKNYAEQPTIPSFTNGDWFNTTENIMYHIKNGVVTKGYGVVPLIVIAESNAGRVKSIQPKQPFRAVDYNDFRNTPSIQAPYIKDTYVNGTSGYRIWSDGYCEQWGTVKDWESDKRYATITLLKPFRDINYCILNQGVWEGMANDRSWWIYSYTPSSIRFASNVGGTWVCWRACGYLASGQY